MRPLVKSRDEINACETCGNSVSQKDHYTKHKHIQTGYNPDKHDICDNRGILFTRIGDFTNHIPSHTGDDPYICGICEKSFSEKDILAEHMIIHIGEKTNEDRKSDNSFTQSKPLPIHTVDKLHNCEVCGKSFTRKSGLTEHKFTHI